MPRKRYTPEDVIQHLRTVELDTGKGLAVLNACRKLGITEQTYEGAVFTRRAVLHAQRSADPDGALADPRQHSPSTQQSRGPVTRSRHRPACELIAHMVGGTTTPGWSVEMVGWMLTRLTFDRSRPSSGRAGTAGTTGWNAMKGVMRFSR